MAQVLGLPKGALRSFVLENDPVPRAMLSADPAFALFKQSRIGGGLLRLRHWLLGEAQHFTPDRSCLCDCRGCLRILWLSCAIVSACLRGCNIFTCQVAIL